MKGHAIIKDSLDTDRLFSNCFNTVSKLSLDDMSKIKDASYKWSWKKLWFVKEEKFLPILNFLYQDRKAVTIFLENLQDCIKQNGEVALSLTSYNELVKLSKGDININSIWLINY